MLQLPATPIQLYCWCYAPNNKNYQVFGKSTKYLYTLVASFLCPLNEITSSFMLRTSNSLMKWSLEAVNSQLPFRFHFTSITVCLCAWLQNTQWSYRAINFFNRINRTINYFNRALIAVLIHILFVTFFNLFALHLQIDIIGPLLLNASLLLVLMTDYSDLIVQITELIDKTDNDWGPVAPTLLKSPIS